MNRRFNAKSSINWKKKTIHWMRFIKNVLFGLQQNFHLYFVWCGQLDVNKTGTWQSDSMGGFPNL